MRPVTVRGVKIGEGIPKICAPLVGRTKDEIIREAKALCDSPADIAEWRADWFDGVYDCQEVEETLRTLRDTLGDLPLLFTFRTMREGGEKEAETKQYAEICRAAASTGYIELLDVELFTGDEVVRKLINEAHEYHVRVIVSNHDFKKTPAREELIRRLCHMQELGADICKIAVMPENRQDVLMLLSATEEMERQYAECPLITMSMGEKGLVSRLCGETFGSAVTFGAVGKTSAPGQIGAKELKTVLEIVHRHKNQPVVESV